MSQISALSAKELATFVRNASRPDHPQLIHTYLSCRAADSDSLLNKRRVLLAQFELLLDTVADVCLPIHWRVQCLDSIHIPLFALRQLVNCNASARQVLALQDELRVTSFYFEPTLIID